MSDLAGLLLSINVFIIFALIFVVAILLLLAFVFADYKRHKKPLRAIDPNISYSFLHHLKVVTLPLFRYRLSIKVSRANPLSKDGLHRF